MEKTHKQRKKGNSVLKSVLFTVLLIYTISLVILLLWGLSTSLKTSDDFYTNKVWLPSGSPTEWGWSNYPYVFQNFFVVSKDVLGRRVSTNIWGLALNTILYAIGGSLVTTTACCLVAYCAAKFKYFFSKVLYTLVLVVMVVPIVGNTPSMLLLLKNTNLYDSWIGTVIMKFNFLGIYFLVFFGIFEGISPEFSEAATIDGANEYQILFRIMLPLVKTTFYTVFLIHFIDYWNDYNMALMYMPTHPTLAFGVYYMANSNESNLSGVEMRMVSCMILALPLVVVFVAFRDRLLGNTMAGGVKE